MKKITLFVLCTFLIGMTFGQTKNDLIVAFAKKNLGKKIDRGECWDLVAFALNDAKATWKAPYDFGTKVNYPKENLLPGDVIMFKNVKFESANGYMSFGEHYALVYEVKQDGKIVIIHQNHNSVRKVQLLEINLNDLKKGTIEYFRSI